MVMDTLPIAVTRFTWILNQRALQQGQMFDDTMTYNPTLL